MLPRDTGSAGVTAQLDLREGHQSIPCGQSFHDFAVAELPVFAQLEERISARLGADQRYAQALRELQHAEALHEDGNAGQAVARLVKAADWLSTIQESGAADIRVSLAWLIHRLGPEIGADWPLCKQGITSRQGCVLMRTSYSFLALLQNAGFSRFMVGVVISAMVAPVYQPVSAAMDPVPDPEDAVHELDVPPGQALSHSVRKAKGLVGRAGQGLRRGGVISAERQELADLRRVVAKLDTEVRREFERTGLLLAERKVPALIRARHEETFARYREEIETLLEDLVNIETETDEDSAASTIGRAYERLSQQKHQASQRPFDPNQLRHEAQRPPEDNLPRTTREEFLGAGLVDNPLVQLAAIEGYRLEGLPGADDPAYLGESAEVRLSPEVNAKAAELDHDPVAIYHWVRNHVEWLPTWGAVQDADLTLSARRGNAMDTASLLIALLRASGIPARYVHGTIDVPEKAFRNWAGGFQHIEEAMNYAASGGIPLTGLIEGGNIAHVRMEHVWVEAAVDFLPSRGAVMREADTWLPLAPSFKQYEFLSGLDIAQITELDGETVLTGMALRHPRP